MIQLVLEILRVVCLNSFFIFNSASIAFLYFLFPFSFPIQQQHPTSCNKRTIKAIDFNQSFFFQFSKRKFFFKLFICYFYCKNLDN